MAMMDKPSGKSKVEPKWFEVHEVALLLESARTYQPPADKHGCEAMYPILATFALTGGRKAEVLGLEVRDVSFERKTVTFRPNEHRGLKTSTSHRVVRLWPQLEGILREYLDGPLGPSEGLLFPSHRGGGMYRDLRQSLDAIGDRVGFVAGEVRTKAFRHSYASARLQSMDNGAPVAVDTVRREMGHGSSALVERVYGHLGQIRQRSEHVEFQVEAYRENLKERLRLIA
jgi:integrase